MEEKKIYPCKVGHESDYYANGQCRPCCLASMRARAARLKAARGIPPPGKRFSPFCAKGHEKTPENTGKDHGCKKCKAQYQRASYKKRIRAARGSQRTCKRGHQAVVGKKCMFCEKIHRRIALAKDPEKIRNRVRKWQRENPEKSVQATRRWQLAHPQEMQVMRAARSAAKRNAIGSVSYEEWKAILKKFKHRCAYCGVKYEKLQQDHVIPLQGADVSGPHMAFNIVPACVKCNVGKKNKVLSGSQHSLFDRM